MSSFFCCLIIFNFHLLKYFWHPSQQFSIILSFPTQYDFFPWELDYKNHIKRIRAQFFLIKKGCFFRQHFSGCGILLLLYQNITSHSPVNTDFGLKEEIKQIPRVCIAILECDFFPKTDFRGENPKKRLVTKMNYYVGLPELSQTSQFLSIKTRNKIENQDFSILTENIL